MGLKIAVALVLALGLSSAPLAEAHRRPAPITATPPISATDVTAAAPAPVETAVPDPPPVLRAAPSLRISPWLVAAALGVAIGLRALGRSRQARQWAILLLFASFTAEIGVHAVHHLDDPRGAADCYALSLGQHLSAAAPTGPELGAPARPTAFLSAPRPEPAAASTSRAPDRGRAPPLRTT
jgi:hypothetical protein